MYIEEAKQFVVFPQRKTTPRENSKRIPGGELL